MALNHIPRKPGPLKSVQYNDERATITKHRPSPCPLTTVQVSSSLFVKSLITVPVSAGFIRPTL